MTKKKIILVVFGGRDFGQVGSQKKRHREYRMLEINMRYICTKYDVEVMVSGGAEGADHMAYMVGRMLQIPTIITAMAQWDKTKPRKAAGPIRNRRLLTFNPTHALMFPGGRGTADMYSLVKKKGLKVFRARDPKVLIPRMTVR